MKSSRLWSLPPLQEIYRQFRVEPEFGLTEEEAGRRLNKWGYNTIQEKTKRYGRDLPGSIQGFYGACSAGRNLHLRDAERVQ